MEKDKYSNAVGNIRKKVPVTGLAMGGILIGAGYMLPAHSQHKENNTYPSAPIPHEGVGDHHGSTGMPSERHLKQFTHEHGIQIHSIPDVVAIQKDHGPVRVVTIESNK